MMKILVLGASGMAGHVIAIYLREQGHAVYALTRKPCDFLENNILCDVQDQQALSEIIEQGGYDAVINCVGILNQFAEENHSAAVYLNSYLPHYLAQLTANSGTKVIHMSTDCVFSGKAGAYTENSLRDGETFYDRSKALGELDDKKNLTFRNSIIGPDCSAAGIGLFNWFMKQENSLNGYTKSIWTGVTTLTLAKAMDEALRRKLCGLYHLVNGDTITKYELCRLFNRYFRADALTVNPVEGVVQDKSLVCTRRDFGFVVPTYEQMIREMKEWVDAHQELYPHYR